MIRLALVSLCTLLALAAACSSGNSDPKEYLDGWDAGTDAGPDGGDPVDAGTDAGTDAGPDAGGDGGDENAGRVTYYINIQDPQADNEACNGLVPQSLPSGPPDCPFRDFTSPRTSRWYLVSNLTIVVMPGTYQIQQQCREGTCDCFQSGHWDFAGIFILTPVDLSADEKIIFRGDNTNGEVILAGGGCTGLCCDYPSVPEDTYDGHPLHLLDILGAQVEVSGFTFEGAAVHNVTWGANHGAFHHNLLRAPLTEDGDSFKGMQVADVQVHDNVFDGFHDQAIDLAGNSHAWIIEHNTFTNGDNAALAGKCGTHDITFRYNTIRDLTNTRSDGAAMGAVGIGGTCQIANEQLVKERCGDPPQAPCYSVDHWRVYGNSFANLRGWSANTNSNAMGGAVFYSCEGCEFYDNEVADADFGVLALNIHYGDPANPDDGLLEHPVIAPSAGIAFYDNRLRSLRVTQLAFAAQSYTSLGDWTGNLHCFDPLEHPDCGAAGDPADARDAVVHPDLAPTCPQSAGGVTLTEAEALLGELGEAFWSGACPF